MICCLFIAALLAPLGLRAAPLPTGGACCTHRLVVPVAIAGAFVAAGCLLLLTGAQAAPFHHICRFLAANRP